MTETKYLQMLVEEIHSTTIATIGEDGHPQTRIIDMMLWDEDGVYFLTAKGKAFYTQLMDQRYVALSATKDKKAVSLRGYIRNIGDEKLDEIFEKNTYMQKIYPGDSRDALEVFQIYQATGEFFDISNPSHIERASIVIGETEVKQSGYYITDQCISCGKCSIICPQHCIDIRNNPSVIDQNHCLHCGRCIPICPVNAIVRR